MRYFFFTRGQFWPSGIVACGCVCACVNLCVNHLLVRTGPVHARITKSGPKVQNNLVKVHELRGQIWGQIEIYPILSLSTPYIQARTTKFGPAVRNTLIKIPLDSSGRWLTLTFKVKVSKFPLSPLSEIHNYQSHEYLDCFTSLTAPWSSACTYIHRPFHGADGFTVSTLCTHTDLGSRGYFGV